MLLVNFFAMGYIGLIFFQLIIWYTTYHYFPDEKPGYNPGFLTAWLVLNPFCVLIIFYAYYIPALNSIEWLLAFIWNIDVIRIMIAKTTSKRKEE